MATCFLDYHKNTYVPSFLYKNGGTNSRLVERFLQRFNKDYSEIYGCSPKGHYVGNGYIEYRRSKFNNNNVGSCGFATDKKIDVTSVSKLKISISDFVAKKIDGTTARIDLIVGLSDTAPDSPSTTSSVQKISPTDASAYIKDSSNNTVWNYDSTATDRTLAVNSCLFYSTAAAGNISVDFSDGFYKTLDLSEVTGSYYIYFFFREDHARVWKNNSIAGLIINEILFER